jgi:hypothetical protein
MDRQDELLEREDGRYFAIDKLGTGLSTIATTERLGPDTVSFGLPSGPALFLHLAHRAFSQVRAVEPRSLFDDHDQGTWPDSQGPLFDYLEGCIAHVIFSFTALEAFANEVIPESFVYTVQRDGATESLTKAEIERRIGLDEKLHSILPSVLSIASPKGTKVWEKYRAVKKIRNQLVHLKSVDGRPSGPDDETIWGTLLKTHGHAWCDDAHKVIGHFNPATNGRRWYGKYPYE